MIYLGMDLIHEDGYWGGSCKFVERRFVLFFCCLDLICIWQIERLIEAIINCDVCTDPFVEVP